MNIICIIDFFIYFYSLLAKYISIMGRCRVVTVENVMQHRHLSRDDIITFYNARETNTM